MHNTECKMQKAKWEDPRRSVYPFCLLHFAFSTVHYPSARTRASLPKRGQGNKWHSPGQSLGGRIPCPPPARPCRSGGMAMLSPQDSAETNALLERAARGDPDGLGRLLERDRDRLRRMVGLRMDRRLAGRID